MPAADPFREAKPGEPVLEAFRAIQGALRELRRRVDELFEGQRRPRTGAIAKNGATAIGAFNTSTLIPGSGPVTIYRFNRTNLAAAETVTAYNLATGTNGTVAANAWLMLKLVDGFWWVDWEACA